MPKKEGQGGWTEGRKKTEERERKKDRERKEENKKRILQTSVQGKCRTSRNKLTRAHTSQQKPRLQREKK